MLRRVDLVRTDVLKEFIAFIIRVKRINELGTTLAVTCNRSTLRSNTMYYFFAVLRLLVIAKVVPMSPILVTLMRKTIRSSEMSVLTRATRRHIPKDGILHGHRRANLNSHNHDRVHKSSHWSTY
jgi:hypothetical protein